MGLCCSIARAASICSMPNSGENPALCEFEVEQRDGDEPRREGVEGLEVDTGFLRPFVDRGVVAAEHALERLALGEHGGLLHFGDHRQRIRAGVVEVDFHDQLLGVVECTLRCSGQRSVAGSQHVDRAKQVNGVVAPFHGPQDAAIAGKPGRGQREREREQPEFRGGPQGWSDPLCGRRRRHGNIVHVPGRTANGKLRPGT